MPAQLPLPLQPRASLTREDFVAAPGNAQALAFVDSWPDWPAPAAVLHGPSGSGKTHLVEIWRARSGAAVLSASGLTGMAHRRAGPLAVEEVDAAPPGAARDAALFAILERATKEAPILLTGSEPPASWPVNLPDLSSRFAALLAFPLWAPDDALLAALARKLFSDRQLRVPDAAIARMIHQLERSPSAIRDFIARADAKALAEGRAVTLPLVRELMEEGTPGAQDARNPNTS